MKLVRKLENIFAAIAFAEADETETARQILMENKEEHVKHRHEERHARSEEGTKITPHPKGI